jgi:hypothetical protein
LNSDLKSKKSEKQIQERIADFFKDYSLQTDKKIFAEVMQTYSKNVSAEYQPEFFKKLYAETSGNFSKMADMIYSQTKLLNQTWLSNFAKKTDATTKEFSQDIAVEFYNAFADFYAKNITPKLLALNKTLAVKQRIYMRGQLEMQTDKTFYPDANSTLRVAYGKVEGFSPVDGTLYKHYTTIEGVMEKSRNSEVADYKIPERLAELYTAKDYGIYTNSKGELPVAFLASNHTTGGNSGSPLFDANGNLIGLNFDRCWESTMSDIMFDPNYCRNISVDIRYVLFIIDKFSGAKRLIDELELVK